jgi:hypothetical protein
MANNVSVKDSAAADVVFKTTDNTSVHTPHHNVDSSALPSGASTSANQTTIIGHLDGVEGLLTTIDGDTQAMVGHLDGVETLLGTIDADTGGIATSTASLDTKTPALGQALAAASVPIVLTAAQITTLTPPAAITGYATSAKQDTAQTTLDAIHTLINTIDTDTSNIVTSVQLLDNAISGSEMQVDVVAALPAGTNAIGKLAANSGVDIGDVDVTSISAGTNNIGNVGLIPRTSGGMTIFRSIDIDESEEEVKGTAGQVFSISAFNLTAAPIYLKFYNATAANTTVGTTTPVLTFVVPGNADSDGAGFVWNNEIGFAFSTAISVAATTGVADADTGAPAANACVINIGYA